jgi:hypothetical protein
MLKTYPFIIFNALQKQTWISPRDELLENQSLILNVLQMKILVIQQKMIGDVLVAPAMTICEKLSKSAN